MKVWILSGPVHCGKTTFLTAWCERVRASGHGEVYGVLGGPDDAEGRRHLTALPSGEVRRVQCLAPEAAALQGARETVTVGAYTFFADSMQWARDTLAAAADALVSAARTGEDAREHVFVLDEVGPLAIVRGLGFEPFVTALFCGERHTALRALEHVHVIVVVRAHLVDKFAAKYLAAAPASFEHFTPECPLWLRYSAGIAPNFPYVPEGADPQNKDKGQQNRKQQSQQ